MSDPGVERGHTTYHYERFRAICSGMLETAGATFLLLIAVTEFKAGATAKALELVMRQPELRLRLRDSVRRVQSRLREMGALQLHSP